MTLTASHDVRVWGIQRYKGVRKTSYEVRWLVNGRKCQRTFTTHKLAESFRATLLVAAREGKPFDVATGLPKPQLAVGSTTWFDHAMAYVLFKWPSASPRHRKGIAEALTTITTALVRPGAQPSNPVTLRRALNRWAFNAQAQGLPIPAQYADAIAWIKRESLPLADIADLPVLRRALGALMVTLDGRPAAKATIVRKRATLHNALEYGVEIGAFDTNPIRRVRVRLPKSEDAVDRRVVVNPQQARALLRAVREQHPELEAFFALLYYAGLRPAEARYVRIGDFDLPRTGWGTVILTGSQQYAGSAWTDSGAPDEERELKHRSGRDTRPVPLHPDVVETLRRHVDGYILGVGGRLFVTRTRRAGAPLAPPYQTPVPTGHLYRAWHAARAAALTTPQVASPLAQRPYDLRHACLSTWLNAGVPPAQVAAWAGHSVDVLLRVYAQCLDGQAEAAQARIDAALREDPER